LRSDCAVLFRVDHVDGRHLPVRQRLSNPGTRYGTVERKRPELAGAAQLRAAPPQREHEMSDVIDGDHHAVRRVFAFERRRFGAAFHQQRIVDDRGVLPPAADLNLV
jgi:hypothetical protein